MRITCLRLAAADPIFWEAELTLVGALAVFVFNNDDATIKLLIDNLLSNTTLSDYRELSKYIDNIQQILLNL